jgi:predicted hydrocarbon binding protein
MMDSATGQKATIEEYEKDYHYIVHQCPDCTGLKDEKQPACFLTVGILKEALYWLSGSHEFRIIEIECMAMNDAYCRFVIPKQPL